jgi:hypothetical protein
MGVERSHPFQASITVSANLTWMTKKMPASIPLGRAAKELPHHSSPSISGMPSVLGKDSSENCCQLQAMKGHF